MTPLRNLSEITYRFFGIQSGFLQGYLQDFLWESFQQSIIHFFRYSFRDISLDFFIVFSHISFRDFAQESFEHFSWDTFNFRSYKDYSRSFQIPFKSSLGIPSGILLAIPPRFSQRLLLIFMHYFYSRHSFVSFVLLGDREGGFFI